MSVCMSVCTCRRDRSARTVGEVFGYVDDVLLYSSERLCVYLNVCVCSISVCVVYLCI